MVYDNEVVCRAISPSPFYFLRREKGEDETIIPRRVDTKLPPLQHTPLSLSPRRTGDCLSAQRGGGSIGRNLFLTLDKTSCPKFCFGFARGHCPSRPAVSSSSAPKMSSTYNCFVCRCAFICSSAGEGTFCGMFLRAPG